MKAWPQHVGFWFRHGAQHEESMRPRIYLRLGLRLALIGNAGCDSNFNCKHSCDKADN